MIGIIRFYKALKPTISSRQPLPKLIAFKLIVFLNFLQSVCYCFAIVKFEPNSNVLQAIFSFLSSSNDLKPTNKITFNDLSVGVPNLILSLEMVLFALAFFYVYRTKPYYFKSGANNAVPLGHGGYQGGFMGIRAYGQAVNFVDILGGMVSIPGAFIQNRNSGASNQKQWASGPQVCSFPL